jgi:hypothetical protein
VFHPNWKTQFHRICIWVYTQQRYSYSCRCREGILEGLDIASLFIYLNTRRSWVFSFTPGLLYPEKSPLNSLNRGLVVLQNWSYSEHIASVIFVLTILEHWCNSSHKVTLWYSEKSLFQRQIVPHKSQTDLPLIEPGPLRWEPGNWPAEPVNVNRR